MRSIGLRAASAALVLLAGLIQGCGGGGGGGGGTASSTSGSNETPNSSGSQSYLLHGEDGIGSAALQFDASGSLLLEDGTKVTFAPSAAPSGCSFTASPSDADLAVCNQLTPAKAYLVCNSATSEYFELALFKSDEVQAVPLSELAGKTLQGVSCGATDVRSLSNTFAISSDGSTVIQQTGNSSFTWSGTLLSEATSLAGMRYFEWQRRFVFYKMTTSAGARYFALDLAERLSESSAIAQPRIYVSQ